MLSKKDMKQWCESLDDETQFLLESASKSESWILDEDKDVQSLLDIISTSMEQKQSSEDGEIQLDYSFLASIQAKDIVKLQAQLGFTRGIKLFGDVLHVDDDLAMSLISFHKKDESAADIDTAISSSLLARRLFLLVRFHIAQRIFRQDSIEHVICVLQNSFNHKD